MSKRVIGTTVALALVAGAATVAVAQFNPWNSNSVNMRSMTDNWGAPNPLGNLASNEGIYVDMTEFRIAKGAAKGDPAAQIQKSGAREVTDGAIIFQVWQQALHRGRHAAMTWKKAGAPDCFRCPADAGS
jgi:hypothetical protein